MIQAQKIPMIKRSAERHTLILSMLSRQEYVSIEAMADECGTSVQTIRRDLSELASQGRLVRYHGGARLSEPESEIPNFEHRNNSNSDAKMTACALLLDLVPDGASLFIAGGSTLAIAAKLLTRRENLTIVTNNLHAAVTLYDKVGFSVFVIGGWLRTASGSLIGEDASNALERFSLDFALISASGMTEEGDLLEFDETLIGPIRTMTKNARQRILIVDSSKFLAKGIVRANSLRDLDHMLTDSEPPPHLLDAIRANGVTLHLPNQSTRKATRD